ncbi:MAG TPA: prephenate dehydrogenase/arogenate dehydrogenase family protein [Actinomycetota bacterium]|nr:prephenate dehydrogenase/arogenate dehydrogenase family protein [Actinomycetota bacterium]
MTTSERVAVVGTGLIGTSIAMAAAHGGDRVRGFDLDPDVAVVASGRAGFEIAATLEECVRSATLVFVSTPVDIVPQLVVKALEATDDAAVVDVASVKSHVVLEVEAKAGSRVVRYVPSHPMGGSERSGPEHASPTILDGAVWVVTPASGTETDAVARVEAWISRAGARPIRMDPARHDRLIAVVSHLPQVAATTLMALAATDEASDPEILRLAAGGFRDLTRLAASDPALWSGILLANRVAVMTAIDRYSERLGAMRDLVARGDADAIAEVFAEAKAARLTLAAKPKVRAGVAVLQLPVPDRPGVLADVTSAMGQVDVNIEDLQIVHSPEGGRGTLHVTVAVDAVDPAEVALRGHGFDPVRIA